MPNTSIIIEEHSLIADFVAPYLIDELTILGISANTPFVWLQKTNNEWVPFTYHFDPNEYYKEADEMFIRNKCMACKMAIRSIDLMEILPGTTTCKNPDGSYTVCIDNHYKLGCTTETRLPDALAAMVIKGLRYKVFTADYINNMLNHRFKR
jgi:hypothetical protein